MSLSASRLACISIHRVQEPDREVYTVVPKGSSEHIVLCSRVNSSQQVLQRANHQLGGHFARYGQTRLAPVPPPAGQPEDCTATVMATRNKGRSMGVMAWPLAIPMCFLSPSPPP